MNGCLDDNEASEFASGSLGPDATTRIERHLATCRDCRSLVAALAPIAGDDEADSDVVTSPRRIALGKKGARAVAMAPTAPLTRRQDPVVVAGDTIGRYIILARLGAGGMGVVYTAYDPQLDRKVALKLLRTGGTVAEGEARSRLIREAQAIAQLSHPNVVAIYDVGQSDEGEVYIAMELVEGENLTSWLGHWDRSWRDILELFFQAGRGLAAAHARGLVHRDFKPDNVLVGADGRVRVTDFGLARSVIEQVDELARDRPRPELEALRVTLTATGTVLGTPRYMAPEQLRGADADARSDQFSFCVALYEALYDRHPLPGDSVLALVQHGTEAAPPPADTKVPASIGKAIMRGLCTDPGKRFPSLAALLLELTPPPAQRRRALAVALAGLALAGVGAATAMVAQGDGGSGDARALADEVERLKVERAEILARLEQLMRDGARDKDEIITLRDKLDSTEQKLRDLELKVADAGIAAPRPRPRIDAAPPPPRGIDDQDLLGAIAGQHGQIESCIQEWIERNPERGATLLVRFSVTTRGAVTARATGMDDVQTPGCVERAVSRASFPPADAVTEGEVLVVVEDGRIRIAPRKTGTANPTETIDL